MLNTVIAKPMQVTKVSAVPFCRGGAVVATRAENCGESAATAVPHSIKKIMKPILFTLINKGESRQHKPEMKSEKKATLALPIRMEIKPPSTQPTLPIAIVLKLVRETFNGENSN